MRFRKTRPKNSEERMLPLINIVFLLLVFFMLAGRLAATDPLQIEAPHSSSEEPKIGHHMVVYMDADGRLAFDGSVLDGTALRSAIAERAAFGELHLKADGEAEARQVIAVMELLRDAGVERLELLTLPKRR